MQQASISSTKRLAQVTVAVAASLCCAGVIFGFAALKPVLIHEGVYEDYCEDEAARQAARETGRPCLSQDLQLNLSFTVSVVVTNLAALPIGMILDNIGPQKTSLLGAIIFALGNFVMGLDRSGGLGRILDPFLTAYVMLAIGGPMLFLSSFHLCNAFPKRSGLILSAIIGAFDASSLPFVIYAAIYKTSGHSVHLREWFWLYTIIPALIFVWQIFFGCPEPYTRESAAGPEDNVEDAVSDERTPLVAEADANRSMTYGSALPSANNSMLRVGSAYRRPNGGIHRKPSVYDSQFSRMLDAEDGWAAKPVADANISKDGGSAHSDPITGVLWGRAALEQIKTSWFWLAQAFLVCYMLRINFYIATVADQVYFYTADAQLASKLTDAFVLLLPLGGVASIPFIGFLLDSRSSAAAFGALLVLGLVFGIGTMTASVALQLVGITAFTIMRPLMYTAISDYFTKVIGIETFGTVYGLANATSGAFTLVQYGFDYAVKRKLHGNYTPLNIFLVSLGAVLACAVILKMRLHARSVAESEDTE